MYCCLKNEKAVQKVKESVPEVVVTSETFIEINSDKYNYLIENYPWSKGLRVYRKQDLSDVIFISMRDISVIYSL